MRHRSFTALVAALLCVSAVIDIAAAAPAPHAQFRAAVPGRQVELRARSSFLKQAPILAPNSITSAQGEVTSAVATADIQVTYNGFSSAAQTAFEAAVQIWETQITSTQVIHVQANWTSLGSGVLGSAGPKHFYLGDDDFAYPVALAEAICSCETPSPYEIDANFNSSFSDWYLGTDGNAPAGKYDFMTVVLHELGHGLGFISSFFVSANKGYWGLSGDNGATLYPLRYDFNEWSAATGGVRLTTEYPNGWTGETGLKAELTDGTVYFGGSNVVATLGSRAKLYAPSPWQSGSSNSHFDETTFPTGTQNALMTPQLANGEVIHNPGPLTLALFRDIGWQTATPAVQPTVSISLPAATNATTVPVTLTETDPAGSGIAGWYLSTNSATPSLNDAGWQVTEPTTFNLPSGDGNKTVYAWVKNNADTLSDRASATVLLDTINPTAAISAPSTTTVQTVSIDLTGSDTGGSGIDGWFVSESSTDPPVSDAGWQTAKPTSFTLSSGLGSKTIYAWSRDAAGNRSSAASAQVELNEPSTDVTPPTVFLPRADIVVPQAIGSTVQVHVSWPEASDTSGIASYQLQYKRNSGAWQTVSLPSPTQTSVELALVPKSYYRLRLAATDGQGNTSEFVTTPRAKLVRPQEKAAAISYSGSWKRVTLSGASGGYVKRSLATGSTATFTVTGSALAFVSAFGPNRGIAEVRLDGNLVATIDLYASSLQAARVVWASSGLSKGTHTLQVRVSGTKNSSASNIRLDVDAFAAWK